MHEAGLVTVGGNGSDGLLTAKVVSVGDDNLCTLASKSEGTGTSDTARSACYDRDSFA